MAETNPGSGARTRSYTYLPGIDRPQSLVLADGTTYYYGMEEPGHVAGVMTSAGAGAAAYEYTPFGDRLSATGSLNQPLQFLGRERDEAGYYYVRARWYDPTLERFVSEDPLGLAGGINPYAYVGNDPINFTDPSGLDPCSDHAPAGSMTVTAADGKLWCRVPLSPIVIIERKVADVEIPECTGGRCDIIAAALNLQGSYRVGGWQRVTGPKDPVRKTLDCTTFVHEALKCAGSRARQLSTAELAALVGGKSIEACYQPTDSPAAGDIVFARYVDSRGDPVGHAGVLTGRRRGSAWQAVDWGNRFNRNPAGATAYSYWGSGGAFANPMFIHVTC